MQPISISNARYIEGTNTLIDLNILTDEGTIPFTYHPDDPAPMAVWVKENIDLEEVSPFVWTLEMAKEKKKAQIRSERTPLFLALDVEFMKRLEAGVDFADIVAQKQALRDAPALVDECLTVEAVENLVWDE